MQRRVNTSLRGIVEAHGDRIYPVAHGDARLTHREMLRDRRVDLCDETSVRFVAENSRRACKVDGRRVQDGLLLGALLLGGSMRTFIVLGQFGHAVGLLHVGVSVAWGREEIDTTTSAARACQHALAIPHEVAACHVESSTCRTLLSNASGYPSGRGPERRILTSMGA